jgi:hypothetical protein
VTAVAKQTKRPTRAQKIAEAERAAAQPTPPLKFLIMMTGDFPQVEPGLKGEDEAESRAWLQQEVIEAIEVAMKPFEAQGIRLDQFRMRVEKPEDFPL